jgi:hypothetical protein
LQWSGSKRNDACRLDALPNASTYFDSLRHIADNLEITTFLQPGVSEGHEAMHHMPARRQATIRADPSGERDFISNMTAKFAGIGKENQRMELLNSKKA